MRLEKRNLRNEMLLKRKKIKKDLREKKSQQIFKNLVNLDEVNAAKRIMVYVDFQEEVQTRQFIEYLWSKNIDVVIPVCKPKNRQLNPSLLYSFDELEPGTFGVLEPKKEAIRYVDLDTIDIIIVPGLAFDRHGGRIGYGAGYYDRFFERTPNAQVIGIAYDEQLVMKIPMEDHDKRIPLIITDKEFIQAKYFL
ncbi:5-formyltetrahydrofolate cyclo-ligase [Desulfuribacillus alkaliarsenatis]|uniref:5-formyltetrahydrofolate cyclo-ligase n=1 Tax=Desulfuribacillus alkaliarsenatis TaxID=766136 RepID=A0A1E5G1V4_9FIRM|nr:5-formyltetrahydrofolate cyclo-ligase [Desulfuribacillus alkaliarsenatis]OEF96968.1 5-formyltetrahydrofolate cyclo-ligase [Desulfuribacillus alkaliarsenatis]